MYTRVGIIKNVSIEISRTNDIAMLKHNVFVRYKTFCIIVVRFVYLWCETMSSFSSANTHLVTRPDVVQWLRDPRMVWVRSKVWCITVRNIVYFHKVSLLLSNISQGTCKAVSVKMYTAVQLAEDDQPYTYLN